MREEKDIKRGEESLNSFIGLLLEIVEDNICKDKNNERKREIIK